MKRRVKCIQMDINCFGSIFPKVKFYPNTNEKLNSSTIKNEDGYWFGLNLNNRLPINVHLFFLDRKWQTNCEYCERDADVEWNHFYDSNIYCENVKVKYIR